jgi:hypothetical protein
MKQKKSGKKLNLNKKTIAALDNRQINAAHGGTEPTCGSCAQTCTCNKECFECDTAVPTSCPSYMFLSECICITD